jgi:four helix bundle protein
MGGFGHGGLVVYRRAVRVAADTFGVVRSVAPEAWPLGRQLVRAASSIPLNIAEGAGEFSAGEKARFYRIARRSAAETAAAYDVLAAAGLIESDKAKRADRELGEIAAMLTTMIKSQISRTAMAATTRPREASVAGEGSLAREASTTP